MLIEAHVPLMARCVIHTHREGEQALAWAALQAAQAYTRYGDRPPPERAPWRDDEIPATWQPVRVTGRPGLSGLWRIYARRRPYRNEHGIGYSPLDDEGLTGTSGREARGQAVG